MLTEVLMPEVVVVVCVHRDEHNDILAVADWGQKLSFYQLSGKQVNTAGSIHVPQTEPNTGTLLEYTIHARSHLCDMF